MGQGEYKPKLGRIRDSASNAQLRTNTLMLRESGRSGARAVRQRGHITSAMPKRGMGADVRAGAGLIAPGSRRIIVKARCTPIAVGDMGAARAHLKYIQRDGTTREGEAGRLYDAQRDDVDGATFLARSENDPHQFRFIVSAEDSARLSGLKPFILDLLAQMERDLDTKLDWVVVDYFNTGHPHTHVVIRGRDDQGRDLVMARDYIGHGVRARANDFELPAFYAALASSAGNAPRSPWRVACCHHGRDLARRHGVRVERHRVSHGVITELPRERKASLPGRRAD